MGSLEGYLRPGCVHLTAQALLTDFAAARLGQQQAQQAEQPVEQAQEAPPVEQQLQQVEGAHLAAAEGQQAASPKPACCCQPKPEQAAAEPAAAAAAASPSEPAPASPAGCCGRKRAAEAPAQPAAVPAAAVRRVVQQMLASGVRLFCLGFVIVPCTMRPDGTVPLLQALVWQQAHAISRRFRQAAFTLLCTPYNRSSPPSPAPLQARRCGAARRCWCRRAATWRWCTAAACGRWVPCLLGCVLACSPAARLTVWQHLLLLLECSLNSSHRNPAGAFRSADLGHRCGACCPRCAGHP